MPILNPGIRNGLIGRIKKCSLFGFENNFQDVTIYFSINPFFERNEMHGI
jgi:hypothetical protein